MRRHLCPRSSIHVLAVCIIFVVFLGIVSLQYDIVEWKCLLLCSFLQASDSIKVSSPQVCLFFLIACGSSRCVEWLLKMRTPPVSLVSVIELAIGFRKCCPKAKEFIALGLEGNFLL